MFPRVNVPPGLRFRKTKALIEMTDETTCQALNVPCFIPLLISIPGNEQCEMQCNRIIILRHGDFDLLSHRYKLLHKTALPSSECTVRKDCQPIDRINN